MESAPISEAEVLRQIGAAKTALQTPNLQQHIYNAMDGLSRTIIPFLTKQSVSTAEDDEGKPLWTPEQSKQIDELLPRTLQVGGFPTKLSSQSSLVEPLKIDISLEKIATDVQVFLKTLDENNRELAKAVGPVAFINKMDTDPKAGPFLPYVPVRLQFPARAILPILNSVLEACRILVITKRFDNPMLRKILSVVLAVLDVSRGEWRDGVLSLLGVISRETLVVGLVAKTARFVYNFISPDIQARLESDIYDSAKSMFIGAWLWLLSVVSPDFLRAQINKLFDASKEALQKFKDTMKPIQEQAIARGKTLGLSVKFPEIPLTTIPSFTDIQNLQSIFHQPEVVCNPGFQAALVGPSQIPAMRVLLELLNIPVTPEAKTLKCEGQPTSMAEALTEAIKPTVTEEATESLAKNVNESSKNEDPKEETETPKKESSKNEDPKEEPKKDESKDESKEDKPKEDKPEEDKPTEEPKKDEPKEDKPKEDKPKEEPKKGGIRRIKRKKNLQP